jgi:hypothetical protein
MKLSIMKMSRRKPQRPWSNPKAVLFILFVLVGTGLITYETYGPRKHTDEPIVATVVGVEGSESLEGSYARVIVELPDGRREPVEGVGLDEYKKGMHVTVQEYKTPLLRIKRYSVICCGDVVDDADDALSAIPKEDWHQPHASLRS